MAHQALLGAHAATLPSGALSLLASLWPSTFAPPPPTTAIPLAPAVFQPTALEGIAGLPNVSYNGLGLVPQMGWNTWNNFGCSISEALIKSAAETLVSSGLRDLGYTYVLIDDCWQAPSRTPDGKPHYDEERFPSGLRNLTDHLHGLGLLAGIYSSAGDHTCALQFGSLGSEEVDAQQYADWGFDYLKYDNCFSRGQWGTPQISFDRYARMSAALLATGRPIFYSLCNWGQDAPWSWASSIANSYRVTGDIDDVFAEEKVQCAKGPAGDGRGVEGYGCSVVDILGKAAPLLQKAVRGSWPDLDMLEVGRGGMPTDAYIVHFSMWALTKSPLILGHNLARMDAGTLAIVSNRALIDFHQGTVAGAGVLAHVAGGPGAVQVWRAAVGDGSFAVAVVNFSAKNVTVDVDFKTIFRDDGRATQAATFRPTDFWSASTSPALAHLHAPSSSSFGAQKLNETVSVSLTDLEVRAGAGRFWLFEPADERERARVLGGTYAMTKE